jgi:Arc/MetJ family transcription regulator
VFGGALWPFDWHVGFLERPFDVVVDAVRDWLRERGGRYRMQKQAGVSLADRLATLAPLQIPATRELVVGMSSGWTAHFDNSTGGTQQSWVGHLSRTLGCRGVLATHVPQGQYPYPATLFELFGTNERSIAAGIFDEGHWSFETHGPVQPYEDTERYTRRLVRERFDRETLVAYLHALGIAADEAAAYGDGLFIQRRVLFKPRTLSLEGARRDFTRAR